MYDIVLRYHGLVFFFFFCFLFFGLQKSTASGGTTSRAWGIFEIFWCTWTARGFPIIKRSRRTNLDFCCGAMKLCETQKSKRSRQRLDLEHHHSTCEFFFKKKNKGESGNNPVRKTCHCNGVFPSAETFGHGIEDDRGWPKWGGCWPVSNPLDYKGVNQYFKSNSAPVLSLYRARAPTECTPQVNCDL